MSYSHWQIAEPILTSGGDTVLSANSTAADVGYLPVGPQSKIIRGVAVQHTTTAAWATGAVFSFRKVCGKYTSATAGQICKVTQTAAQGLREDGFYYNVSFTPVKLPGGYGITIRLTTAATTKLFRAWAILEPSWERFSNLTTGTTSYHVGVTG